MKMETSGQTLQLSGIKELSGANADWIREQVLGAFTPPQTNIDVDLAETVMVDTRGLGVLLSLHQVCCQRQGKMRLCNPRPSVLQLMELTRVGQVIEIASDC